MLGRIIISEIGDKIRCQFCVRLEIRRPKFEDLNQSNAPLVGEINIEKQNKL